MKESTKYRHREFAIAICFLLLCAVGRSAKLGQQEKKDNGKVQVDVALSTQRPIIVEVPLVLVPVSVVDSYNRFVTGLEKDQFRIFEDKKPQQIASLSTEDAPISVGLVFDASGSMQNKAEQARTAVMQFFRSSNPQDEFFLICFSDRPNLVSDFTQDEQQLQSSVNFTQAKGRTALLDAIYLGLHEMRKARHSRKVLLVFSDGGDNHSRYTEGELKEAIRESQVQIYTVGIYEPYTALPGSFEQWFGPRLMAEIAEMTGGRQFSVENPNDLAEIARKVGRELRNLYVVGYRPSNDARDGKWRKIEVRVDPPRGLRKLQIFNKSGYYSPQE